MATLMHAPLTCSLAARIAAAEGGVSLNTEYLNLRTKTLENGSSLYDINPLGQVSVLRFDNGEILTETSTCLLWIQSQSENSHFHRSPNDPEYFQMLRWIAFCATELHKQIFRVVFYPEATDSVKDKIRDLAPLRFEVLNNHLADREFLVGDSFSAADAYLTWFFVLAENARLNPSEYEHLNAYRERMLARPLIKALIESDRLKDREMNQQIIPEI
ncbi:glutathione binding-like protein [Aliamphritea spongicola]|uniref:glutathione binding-like protein n=1 Tax=Aliamphritea spongicola TaxID=707589 RepID=UPI00196A4BD2|nr:glutathione binding-like protein [Aliamphritea spongicola]MBN3563727.1 glutathione S-transferase family protein [Aliamphritea spongicola]